jgi:hypothetical protein
MFLRGNSLVLRQCCTSLSGESNRQARPANQGGEGRLTAPPEQNSVRSRRASAGYGGCFHVALTEKTAGARWPVGLWRIDLSGQIGVLRRPESGPDEADPLCLVGLESCSE